MGLTSFAPFAEVEDVEAVWGELSVAEGELVEGWISQASIEVRVKARRSRVDIDALIRSDELAAEAVKSAVVNAVRRVLMNTDGLRQKSRTVGPFTESGTIDSALSTGQVYIDDADLVGVFTTGKGGVCSFRVRSGF